MATIAPAAATDVLRYCDQRTQKALRALVKPGDALPPAPTSTSPKNAASGGAGVTSARKLTGAKAAPAGGGRAGSAGSSPSSSAPGSPRHSPSSRKGDSEDYSDDDGVLDRVALAPTRPAVAAVPARPPATVAVAAPTAARPAATTGASRPAVASGAAAAAASAHPSVSSSSSSSGATTTSAPSVPSSSWTGNSGSSNVNHHSHDSQTNNYQRLSPKFHGVQVDPADLAAQNTASVRRVYEF